MFYLKRLLGMAVVALGLSSAPGFTATLNVDDFGQLVGASNVNVNDKLYDVAFLVGTCVDVFDGCDNAADFTFMSSADAIAASYALLDQVFLDVAEGDFDYYPDATKGCDPSSFCKIATPWRIIPGMDLFEYVFAINHFGNGYDDVDVDGVLYGPGDVLGSYHIWAVWSPAADISVVPLPAGGVLLLSALGGIAALRRRKKRTA